MKINNNKGAGLVLVMLVMVVLTILGTALLSISSSSARLIAYQKKVKQAYYLAKSGADATATYLVNNPNEDTLLLDKTSDDTMSYFTGNPDDTNPDTQIDFNSSAAFNVQVAPLSPSDKHQIRITGNGKVGTVEKSTSAVIRRLTVGELINKAIYTNSTLDITNMVVEGDIQSGGDIEYKTNGHNQYDVSIYKPLPNSPLSMETVLPETIPDKYGTDGVLHVNGANVPINKSYSFTTLTIDQGKTLEINVGNSDINIIVDDLVGKGNIDINTTGIGRVNLFVNHSFVIWTNGNINNINPSKLYIYMQAGSTFDLQAGIKVYAFIIAPDADAVIQSEKSTIFGSLIANKITKNGTNPGANGSVVFIPPENTSEVDENLKAYKMLRWEE